MAPATQTLTATSPTNSPYRLDLSQTSKASSALLKHIQKDAQDKQKSEGKKDIFSSDLVTSTNAQPVWLVLSTKQHIINHPKLKPTKITVPHSLHTASNLSICLITPDPQRRFKDIINDSAFPPELSKKVCRVVDIVKLKAKYRTAESQRALRDSHDVFLADDRIVTFLPKILGKVFYGSATKRPIPIRLEATKQKTEKANAALPSTKKKKEKADVKSVVSPVNAAKEIEKALATTQVYLHPSVTTSIRVGLSSHTPQQLVDNINAVVEDMTEKHIPRKWRGVQSVHIKGPNSTALPIWLASELWADEEHVVEDEALRAILQKRIEDKKRKRLGNSEADEQSLIENGDGTFGSKKRAAEDEGVEKVNGKKQKPAEDDFSQEMKERRAKLREQKKKVQASLDAQLDS